MIWMFCICEMEVTPHFIHEITLYDNTTLTHIAHTPCNERGIHHCQTHGMTESSLHDRHLP